LAYVLDSRVMVKLLVILISMILIYAFGILSLEMLLNYYSPGTWMWFTGALGPPTMPLIMFKLSFLIGAFWDEIWDKIGL
jgi:hypothetical protein